MVILGDSGYRAVYIPFIALCHGLCGAQHSGFAAVDSGCIGNNIAVGGVLVFCDAGEDTAALVARLMMRSQARDALKGDRPSAPSAYPSPPNQSPLLLPLDST